VIFIKFYKQIQRLLEISSISFVKPRSLVYLYQLVFLLPVILQASAADISPRTQRFAVRSNNSQFSIDIGRPNFMPAFFAVSIPCFWRRKVFFLSASATKQGGRGTDLPSIFRVRPFPWIFCYQKAQSYLKRQYRI